MKLGEWNHAARCATCCHGIWAKGVVWGGTPQFDAAIAAGSDSICCPKCGSVRWYRDVGRCVSARVWWDPRTWFSEPRWEWRNYPPPVPPVPPVSYVGENVIPFPER